MTALLASFADFLGNIWFALVALAGGYIAGNLFPLSWIASKVKK